MVADTTNTRPWCKAECLLYLGSPSYQVVAGFHAEGKANTALSRMKCEDRTEQSRVAGMAMYGEWLGRSGTAAGVTGCLWIEVCPFYDQTSIFLLIVLHLTPPPPPLCPSPCWRWATLVLDFCDVQKIYRTFTSGLKSQIHKYLKVLGQQKTKREGGGAASLGTNPCSYAPVWGPNEPAHWK